MEIHELRIGNIVDLNGFNTVESITSRDFIESGQATRDESELILKDSQGNYYECSINHDNLKPVLLTDVILRSCPEISICIYSKDKYILRNPDSQFHIIKHNEKFIFRGLGMSVVEVETVHHLQNLVYFNTKKELYIKL